MLLLSIFAGGMLGTAMRYTVSSWIYRRLGSAFPWGTLTVNMVGSLALGLVLPLFDMGKPLTEVRGFVTVGCIGAFTTFSTFAYEAVLLEQRGARGRAAVYALASVILGLATIGAGLHLAHRLY
jgi:fluoride exporter